MISFIPVTKSEIKDLITLAFEGDRDLLETYHISPGDLEHCVNHTYNFIVSNKDFYDEEMALYKVQNENKDTIGFTITINHKDRPNELYSFGIAKQYRKKDTLIEWLSVIEKTIGSPYYLILWNANVRAIEFFEKNGFIVEQRNDLAKLIIKDDLEAS